jgi:hypothetical protein
MQFSNSCAAESFIYIFKISSTLANSLVQHLDEILIVVNPQEGKKFQFGPYLHTLRKLAIRAYPRQPDEEYQYYHQKRRVSLVWHQRSQNTMAKQPISGFCGGSCALSQKLHFQSKLR